MPLLSRILPLTIPLLILAQDARIFAQCYPDRHSTNWFDGWVSCETAPNPNPERGPSHWIMYDFGKEYALGQMHVWNFNDPAYLDRGLQDVEIDISSDGITWQYTGNFTFAQANGKNVYEGFAGPDLQNVQASYLLITAVNNYGDDCYGLGEIRIAAEDVMNTATEMTEAIACLTIEAFPNPFRKNNRIKVKLNCPGELRYAVVDIMGHIIESGNHFAESGIVFLKLHQTDWPTGNYMLKVWHDNEYVQQKLVKLE